MGPTDGNLAALNRYLAEQEDAEEKWEREEEERWWQSLEATFDPETDGDEATYFERVAAYGREINVETGRVSWYYGN